MPSYEFRSVDMHDVELFQLPFRIEPGRDDFAMPRLLHAGLPVLLPFGVLLQPRKHQVVLLLFFPQPTDDRVFHPQSLDEIRLADRSLQVGARRVGRLQA